MFVGLATIFVFVFKNTYTQHPLHPRATPDFKEQISPYKETVQLIQQVKMAHSFLQSVSNLFHFIILSLPV